MQMPAGILYLHLIEARNLPNMDWISKTDAYALVYVRGRRKRRTHVVYNSLCPKYVTSAFCHCSCVSSETLTVKVDRDWLPKYSSELGLCAFWRSQV